MGKSLPDLRDASLLIDRALKEDIGSGDHSSLSCIPVTAKERATIISRESGIICGVSVACEVFARISDSLEVLSHIEDGDFVTPGSNVLEISGPARDILTAERTALNFLQRLTAIATTTHKLSELIKPYGTTLLDTRKTTPGWRILEKWAVRTGGGNNHRMGLYDMVMLKDNHIAYAGGVIPAIKAAQQYLHSNNLNIPVVVEAASLDEVKAIIKTGGADRILLDNMSIDELNAAISLIGASCKTEASGGITFENIEAIAKTGVDYISTSLMTQAPGQFDLSMVATDQVK